MVLAVILLAPIVLRRLRIPSIIGLIVAGIVLGEHGLGLIERDRSFEIFGQVGIYLIMFMAGLGLDLGSVKRFGREGIVFGVLTFLVPFVMGLAASHWLLGFGWVTSTLLACILSSHTLVTYPVVQRYGLSHHPKVVVSVVATAFTTFLSLLIFAVMIDVEASQSGWDLLFLALSIVSYMAAMIFCVPRLARWFLRSFDDRVTQFIFILLLLFFSAALARIAGIAPLLGAFLCGLLVNRLIPRKSPMMNRIEFFSDALFVPYFLIGVGMLIDIRVFMASEATALAAAVMVVIGLLSKWIAAALHQTLTRSNSATRLLSFGLSSAHSAGALAIVMTAAAPEVGLLDDTVLNASVMLILFSCVVSSVATDRGARRLTIREARTEENRGATHGRCLTLYFDEAVMPHLTQLSIMLCNHAISTPVMGLTVTLEDKATEQRQSVARQRLDTARRLCSAADVDMRVMSRVSNNIVSGVHHTMREFECGEVLLAFNPGESQSSLLSKLVDAVPLEVVAYYSLVPPSTLRHIVVAMPQKAELEVGFYKWLEHVCRVAANIDARVEFHAPADTLSYLRSYLRQHHGSLRAEYHEMSMWTRIMSLQQRVGRDDLMVFVASRPGYISYRGAMSGLLLQLRRYFSHTNILLIYPDQGQ